MGIRKWNWLPWGSGQNTELLELKGCLDHAFGPCFRTWGLGGSTVEPGVGPDGPCGSLLIWDVLSLCEQPAQLADGMVDLCCSCWVSVQKESGGFK